MRRLCQNAAFAQGRPLIEGGAHFCLIFQNAAFAQGWPLIEGGAHFCLIFQNVAFAQGRHLTTQCTYTMNEHRIKRKISTVTLNCNTM